MPKTGVLQAGRLYGSGIPEPQPHVPHLMAAAPKLAGSSGHGVPAFLLAFRSRTGHHLLDVVQPYTLNRPSYCKRQARIPIVTVTPLQPGHLCASHHQLMGGEALALIAAGAILIHGGLISAAVSVLMLA